MNKIGKCFFIFCILVCGLSGCLSKFTKPDIVKNNVDFYFYAENELETSRAVMNITAVNHNKTDAFVLVYVKFYRFGGKVFDTKVSVFDVERMEKRIVQVYSDNYMAGCPYDTSELCSFANEVYVEYVKGFWH